MVPVEILAFQENIILRARGSELLIHSAHVRKLQDLKKPRDFSQYFRGEALVNRPARKLFEAWLRKDHTLWPRLYKTVQSIPLSEKSSSQADDGALSRQAEAKAPEPSVHQSEARGDAPQSSLEAPISQLAETASPDVSGAKKTRSKSKVEIAPSEGESTGKKRASKTKADDSEGSAEKEAKKGSTSKKAAKPEGEKATIDTSKPKKSSADKTQVKQEPKETKGKKKG